MGSCWILTASGGQSHDCCWGASPHPWAGGHATTQLPLRPVRGDRPPPTLLCLFHVLDVGGLITPEITGDQPPHPIPQAWPRPYTGALPSRQTRPRSQVLALPAALRAGCDPLQKGGWE